jgi:hypothetical protein
LDFSPSNGFGPASSLLFQPSRGPPPPSFSSPAAAHLLPPFLAQSRPTSSLPFWPSRPDAFTPLTGGPTPSVSPTVFFLRTSDRAPSLPPPPRATAAPMTPPLPWQNESAPLFLSPDSPYHLPISSPLEMASPLKLHRAAAGYSSTACLRSSPAL